MASLPELGLTEGMFLRAAVETIAKETCEDKASGTRFCQISPFCPGCVARRALKLANEARDAQVEGAGS